MFERLEVPIGDPRGIDPHTGISPAERKMAELEKEDQGIESMNDENDIEVALDDLGEKLKQNPSDPDLRNKVARLQAKLEKILQDSSH